MTHDLLTVLYLAAHVDWYAHNDYWDGDARYQRDDHRCAEQHAHLPQNLAGLRPWLLPPECTSWGTEAHRRHITEDQTGVQTIIRHRDKNKNKGFILKHVAFWVYDNVLLSVNSSTTLKYNEIYWMNCQFCTDIDGPRKMNPTEMPITLFYDLISIKTMKFALVTVALW